MKLHLEPVSARALIDQVVAIVEPLAQKRGNRLVVDKGPDDFMVHADEMRLRQALLNLLSNAIRFTNGGTMILSLQEETLEGRPWVCWTVRDTGIGIAPEDIGRLFRPFCQLDASATRKYGGTGLGLVISERLCSMMGGHITVESRLGEGSAFSVHLPAPRGAPAAEGDPARPVEAVSRP